jgi:hypothetical protein
MHVTLGHGVSVSLWTYWESFKMVSEKDARVVRWRADTATRAASWL